MKYAALVILCAGVSLVACQGDEVDGVYLILELENSANIKRYSLFNDRIKDIETCEERAPDAIPGIMARAPKEVPADSRVTGWRCSLVAPEKGG